MKNIQLLQAGLEVVYENNNSRNIRPVICDWFLRKLQIQCCWSI